MPRRLQQALASADLYTRRGEVEDLVGLTIAARGPRAAVGELCRVDAGGREILAQVVGFKDRSTLVMPLGPCEGISPGSTVTAVGREMTVPVGPALVGRVLDGLGRPADGKGPVATVARYPARRRPPDPLARARIREPLSVGVRAIDAVLTCGRGQRLGIFSGSGVGKSTLLGMIARNTSAAVSVIGLIGERGREVREFIERDLGPEGLARSVVVVATSDQPALVRINAALVATAIAEYFRDRGQDVVLMMDAVTRYATALREVGLATGEPPATRGYPPSVFADLPRLLERSGTSTRGSITGFYSVLVEGDDLTEPVADTVRGILDGHIVLSRRLATQGHYPAIDVLGSISRSMVDIVGAEQLGCAQRLRSLLAAYGEAEDLINIGAYVPGSNEQIDLARAYHGPICSFLRQGTYDRSDLDSARQGLLALFSAGPGEGTH
ncbi:MAG: FliI/YscN family ATPase [Bacillota bacterium]